MTQKSTYASLFSPPGSLPPLEFNLSQVDVPDQHRLQIIQILANFQALNPITLEIVERLNSVITCYLLPSLEIFIQLAQEHIDEVQSTQDLAERSQVMVGRCLKIGPWQHPP